MAEESAQDKRIENVKERLADDLVDEHGNPADPAAVARVVDEAARPLADAPVQEFTPLLIEHEARDVLREEGLRRDSGDESDNEPTAKGDDHDRAHSDDGRDALHLSTQQGLATPESRPTD